MDLAAELVLLKAAGCDPLDIARLARLRLRVGRGEVHEDTTEHRRLKFERWRFEHRQLDGDRGPAL